MTERNWQGDWQVSLDTEDDPKIRLLSDLVGGTVRANSEFIAAQLISARYSFETILGDDGVEDLIDASVKSDFYDGLSRDDKKHVANILELPDESVWRYGSKLHTDGLWDAQGPVAEVAFERSDALVLNGAVGAELFGVSKRLDRLSAAVEPDMFRRAVLLGGLAMAGKGVYFRGFDGDFYRGKEHDGLVPETTIGGDMHGDFRTYRQDRFRHDAIDPTGQSHVFGPSLERTLIPAYHSTETYILGSLLAYRAAFTGVERQGLFSNLVHKAATVTYRPGGAFGDYGQDDGHHEAGFMDYLITQGIEEGDILANLTFLPQNSSRFILTAKNEGVEFALGTENKENETIDMIRSFVVPADEIEDYAITLLQSGHGRTSQSALLNVMAGLRDGKSAGSATHRPFSIDAQ